MSRKPPQPSGMPEWFDAAAHHVGPFGIVETATGTLLAEDGLPASTALRLKRQRDAAPSSEGVTDAS